MTSRKNLLVELLVEELPPKALKKLGEAFGQALLSGLRAQGLADAPSVLTGYATPRRLAAHISHVASAAADQAVSTKLMPLAVALTADGQPTPALLKKLAALGVPAEPLPPLRRAQDGKAEALFLDSTQRGVMLAAGLQRALDDTLAKLPIPKVMQYQLEQGSGADFQPGWTSVNFVRPAHGLVALHGADEVPVTALGLHAGRQTRGHRFEAPMDPVMLQDADHYARQLEEQGAVLAGFEHRRSEIQRQLQDKASALGLKPIDDAALLDEVTALVERPNVLLCQFEPEFLSVPPECLILTMKANQKYFPLLDDKGKLTHQFLVVSNISPADASRVIEGNERVVRPRLADAKFFFDQDRKKTLASRVPGLDKVVYHGKLGTQGERMQRVRAIARALASALAEAGFAAYDKDAKPLVDLVDRAAELAKTDLLSDMVGEFPELQGTMGHYYAEHDGENKLVAEAIEHHYRPRFSGDDLPRSDVGLVVALADKLETLAGLFGIGQLPTGDKDPFALRRHAIGVIRILQEKNLPLKLADALQIAFGAFEDFGGLDLRASWHLAFGGTAPEKLALLSNFIYDRLSGSLREHGYSAQEVDAVVALRPGHLGEIPRRLEAVRAFASLPEAASLAAANKRVGNILKKSEASAGGGAWKDSLLQEPAEQALAQSLRTVAPLADAAFQAGDFTASLQTLAALKAPVDAFFDSVMVNAEDPALRNNRLALLQQLHAAMNRVADLARLAN